MAKKIKRNEICDVCGKIATVNISNMWHKFDIDKNGNYVNEDTWEGEAGGTFCDKHSDEFTN